MTNKFLFKMQMSYVAKNKMDGEINEYFRSLDAMLINGRSDLTSFRREARAKVKEIHEAHPRCKNIPLDIFSLSGEDETVKCGSTHATIYTVKDEFKPMDL